MIHVWVSELVKLRKLNVRDRIDRHSHKNDATFSRSLNAFYFSASTKHLDGQ